MPRSATHTTAPQLDAAGVAHACKAIRDAPRRDGVLEALLRGAADHLERPQLYRVRGGHLQGLLELEPGGVSRETMAHRIFGFGLARDALRAVQSGSLQIAAARSEDGAVQPARLWVPISLGDRVVCMLTGVAADPEDPALHRQLSRLVEEAGLALYALVVATRCVGALGKRSSPSERGPATDRDIPPGVRLLTRRKRLRSTRAAAERDGQRLALRPRPRGDRVVAVLPDVPAARQRLRRRGLRRRAAAPPPAGRPSRQRRCREVVVDPRSAHRFYSDLAGEPRGVFVATDQPLPLGQTIELSIELGGLGVSGRVRCEVAWLRVCGGDDRDTPRGMGLRFVEPPPEPLRGAIERFAARHGTLLYA